MKISFLKKHLADSELSMMVSPAEALGKLGDREMQERPFSDISYEQFLNEEKLMGSRCKKCDALFVPPKPICTKCYSPELEWTEMMGKGKLTAFTCIAIGLPSMMAEGYNRKNPYCSGVVELEEGVLVDARIEEVDTKNPEFIKVGMPLTVEFLH